MSRYIYIPMSYQDYLQKYFNTLKTGELLVDLVEHDIYVTEEGINLPIPITKVLRENIIDFLENDMEGIKLRKNVIPGKINNLYNIYNEIYNKQEEIFDTSLDIFSDMESARLKTVYLGKISKNNVNQLGDISLQLDGLDLGQYNDLIQSQIDIFNNLSNNSLTEAFSNDANSKNTELLQIWNNIKTLMDEVNQKLIKMGSFSGTMQLQKSVSYEKTAYDCRWDRRLFNYSSSNYTSESQYVDACVGLRSRFSDWFYQGSAIDPLTLEKYSVTEGTGVFYRGFYNKVNKTTGTRISNRYLSWDMFEGLPLTGTTSSPANTIGYIRSPSNLLMPLYESPSGFASKTTFTTSSNGFSPNPSVKYGGGSATWRQKVNLGGKSKKWKIDPTGLNRISTLNSDNLQRLPKSRDNSSSPFSTVQRTIPFITKQVRYVSARNIINRDSLVLRLGLKKVINETKITTVKYKYNNTKGWVKS
ncbi:hypothetical protein FPHOBKDP_00210 [Listeria phage LPJP1]|nr:hypothetical protein FPHOBKDP_00210 [Listeria phage LPJP1]